MSSGPLVLVLEAFAQGAASLDEIAQRTGLTSEATRAAVDHLIRIGRIESRQLTTGCPEGGCGRCASGAESGAPGCGADAPSPLRRGPVLVSLTLADRQA